MQFTFRYDVLLDILHRLGRRALARSRRVCRAWRSIVDGHGLLLPHAFPRDEFPGIYATYHDFPSRSAFFACLTLPSSGAVKNGARYRRPFAWKDLALDPYVWTDWAYVQQHCNGLLLVRDRYAFDVITDVYVHVCNPARMWRARLPRPPSPWPRAAEGMFLAFDPAVSRHYEVFLLPEKNMTPLGVSPKKNVIPLLVLSSKSGRWENQQFASGRCALGHLYDLITAPRRVEKGYGRPSTGMDQCMCI